MLIGVIALGLLALYAIQRGPSLFMRPPSSERIAFVSDRGGRPDIWTMRTDGSDKRAVTNDSADERAPAWSPSGAELAYTSDKDGGTFHVFVSAWNGRYSHRMTTSAGTKDLPVWSRDGGELTFISSGKVYVRNRSGGREEQYLPPAEIGGLGMSMPYIYAAWSPDGKALLCVQETDMGRESYAMEIDRARSMGSRRAKPLGVMAAKSLDVAWAPTGRRVAAAFMNSEGVNGLLVADLDAVEGKSLFQSGGDGRGAARPAWSPDGKNIAFEMWAVKDGVPDRCVGIYTINASGGTPKMLLEGDAREPCWSADGRRIVCAVARDDGKRDIWRVDADGSDAVNLTDGEGDNYNPTWSPKVRRES